MGITGLHGLLKSIQKPCNLKKFSGQTLGVDAYGWLHRGTIACAIDLALGKPTTKHVDFAMNRVRMLIYFGITPYIVFDGDNLPGKSGTEESRLARREESRKIGLELYRKGKHAQAQQELQKAVDVTPYMARQLIEELKKAKIQYVVAPYEADAQLAYLEQQGYINGIISEDSDLLVFGAKRLLSKLDQHGDCIEINRSDFTACRDISLIGWSDADFRRMCILSGCDYLPSIPKMGLKTAYRSIRKYKTVDRVLKMLQFEGQYRIPPMYQENFKQAELTFLHQWVFNPKEGKLVMLTPPDKDILESELTCIGKDVDPETAIGVACGDIDPMTKDPINLKPSVSSKLQSKVTRRQTLPAQSDMKPSKPINSFFTPKRTPLAELDPNTLTPSPSQQRLLELHANNNWEATPVPSNRVTPRSVSSAPAFRPTRPSMVRSAERQSFLSRASTVSKFQPAKRQRLCSDTDDDSLPPSSREGGTSRFFQSSNTEASPAVQKKMRAKKPRKSDFTTFSDDVAEDIMSQMPSTIGPLKVPKLRVFSEGKPKPPRPDFQKPSGDGLVDESQEMTAGGETSISQVTDSTTVHEVTDASQHWSQSDMSGSTQATSVGDHSNPGSFTTPTGSSQDKATLARLHSKFAYNGGLATSNSEGGTSHTKEDDSGGSQESSAAPPSASQSRLTPLQRLGQNALGRSRSMGTLRTNSQPTPAISTASKYTSHHTLARSRSFIPRAITPSEAKGSEDMIVSNSEDEGEELEETPSQPTIDLKQFSFQRT
ncbi:Rad2 nuclease [Arachnomyces sp. PD_36]|nr:Rad2 nuclease [Arachnomyces sp. PD_36]